MKYSVAIRTLGKNPETLKRELESIARQTVLPNEIIIYIAEGYERPSYTIGEEKYVWVRKGMVAQRALKYEEISSEVVLMLDDDVELAEDSAEKMLKAMENNGLDCLAADTFKNQDMSWKQKVAAFLSNFVYARKDDGWAFKQCRNGSFTFNENPQKSLCLTETFAGPCWMVKKDVLHAVHLEDELWLDSMGFAYGEDAVESYKFYLNGYRSGVLYDSGVKNLDAKTSSGGYHRSDKKFYTRSFGMFATWWRMIYSSRDKKWLSVLLYSCKVLWQVLIHLLLGLKMMNVKVPYNYLKGQVDAWRYVHTETFKAIPSYVINKSNDENVNGIYTNL